MTVEPLGRTDELIDRIFGKDEPPESKIEKLCKEILRLEFIHMTSVLNSSDERDLIRELRACRFEMVKLQKAGI